MTARIHTIFLLLACLAFQPTLARAADLTLVTGTWEGESKCTIPDSPCHNEHVIYEIAADKRATNTVRLDAYKVVSGEKQFMGTLECSYQSRQATLSCTGHTRHKDDWEFKMSGTKMTGTLVLDDKKTLYRKISVAKK